MTTQVSRPDGALIRVTVLAGDRRADLVLPAAVSVADLVPGLARALGLLDPDTAAGGFRVATGEGRELRPDRDLGGQGIHDGAVIVVAARAEEVTPLRHDDLVEAVAEAVAAEVDSTVVGRPVAQAAAGGCLALGAATLVLHGTRGAGAAAAIEALTLLALSLLLAQRDLRAAVVLAWAGAVHAGVGGLLLVSQPGPRGASPEPWSGAPLFAAGTALVTAGLVSMAGLTDRRPLAMPPVVAGSVAIVLALVERSALVAPAVVLTAVLAAATVAGSAIPAMALRASGVAVPSLAARREIHGEIRGETAEIDVDGLRVELRTAHDLMTAMSLTAGMLVLLGLPAAATRGWSGTLLAVTCCVVVMLRTRHARRPLDALVDWVVALAGLALVAVALVSAHPELRPAAAGVLFSIGAVVVAVSARPSGPSALRGWAADGLEFLSLALVLPLFALASGAFDAVRG